MKQKIGIVGCGPWANTVIKKIEQNDLLDLRYVICRNKNNKKKISSKYKFFKTFDYSQLNSFKSPETNLWYSFDNFTELLQNSLDILHFSSKIWFQ